MNKQKTVQIVFGLWLPILFIPVIFSVSEINLVLIRQDTMRYICHQKLERFFDMNSHYPLVCARDIGIYAGLFILSFFRIEKLGYKSLYFLIPFVFDKVLEKIIGIDPGNTIRFISGILIGVPIMVLIQFYMFKKYPVQQPDYSD